MQRSYINKSANSFREMRALRLVQNFHTKNPRDNVHQNITNDGRYGGKQAAAYIARVVKD